MQSKLFKIIIVMILLIGNAYAFQQIEIEGPSIITVPEQGITMTYIINNKENYTKPLQIEYFPPTKYFITGIKDTIEKHEDLEINLTIYFDELLNGQDIESTMIVSTGNQTFTKNILLRFERRITTIQGTQTIDPTGTNLVYPTNENQITYPESNQTPNQNDQTQNNSNETNTDSNFLKDLELSGLAILGTGITNDSNTNFWINIILIILAAILLLGFVSRLVMKLTIKNNKK